MRIGTPHPLLADGLVLVDTPGVGGVFRGHTAATMAFLPSADAIIFVSDFTQPILRSELDFLRLAAAAVRSVGDDDPLLFVMTKSDLVGLADGAVGIEEALAQLIECDSPTKDQVVAILHLREEQAMLASGLFPLVISEERCETSQPLLAAGQQIAGAQGVREFLELVGITAFQEGVGTLLEVDFLFLESLGQPVMLIQADAR